MYPSNNLSPTSSINNVSSINRDFSATPTSEILFADIVDNSLLWILEEIKVKVTTDVSLE